MAAEKAGILKPGVPVVVAPQRPEAAAAIAARACAVGAPMFRAGREWSFAASDAGLAYRGVEIRELPTPALPGAPHFANAAAAVAAAEMLPGRLGLAPAAVAAGIAGASWPARLQRLTHGPLLAALPPGCELWLDGGHNEDGARAIADWARAQRDGVALDIVVALRSTKRAEPILAALRPVARMLVCVGNPADPVASPPAALAATARAAGLGPVLEAADAAAALRLLPEPRRVLICGSLYLAGAVLAENR
jgi:dihydrofolate synthase/folylpolyglutamate synthase